jgi:vacuolar-type H+-ATPase subunit E/Vma4
MRMSKMRLRFEMIEKIQQDIKGKIIIVLENQNNYEELLTKLMTQGMIKLLEEKVEVQCLKRDLDLVKKVAEKCEREFNNMCTVQSKLVVNGNRCLPESDLGGVILTSFAGRIVCNNTLKVRLEYALQMFLPDVRLQLFGQNK